ncbi:unnamed protein product [Penicillium glandicola]
MSAPSYTGSQDSISYRTNADYEHHVHPYQPEQLYQPQQSTGASPYTLHNPPPYIYQQTYQQENHGASSIIQANFPIAQSDRQYESSAQKQKPCVIPRKNTIQSNTAEPILTETTNNAEITKVFGGTYLSPFARAHAPELEQQTGLSPAELLAFIDGLNEAFLANPALQATNAVGNLVGLVPLQSTQLVGGGINLIAGLGSAGVSKVRTQQYMETANATIFKPKGLHAQICKTEKMLERVGLVNEAGLFAHQHYRDILEDARPGDPDALNVSRGFIGNPIEKRMEGLGGKAMKLSFDNLSAPVEPDNWMKKLGAHSAQRAGQKQGKADDGVEDVLEKMEELRSQMRSLDPTQRQYKKVQKELSEKWKKLEKRLKEAKKDSQRDKVSKQDKRIEKHQKKEAKKAKKAKKISWIVIMPEESDLDDDDWDSEED